MPSYTLHNTNNQIDQAISGSYTALFGGGFAGNLRVNGTISGVDGNFQSTNSADLFCTNIETSDLNVSSSLLVEGIGRYTKPQHFNSGILIGRNAAPNFFTPTLVVSGVSEFKYPVLIGGFNSSPVLSVSGDAIITGAIIARDFSVTGQILPSNEAVSGRIPIFQSNTGTFSQIFVTGGCASMFDGIYDLNVLGDSSFSGSLNIFGGEIISEIITANTLFTCPVGAITTFNSASINASYITGQSGAFPLSLLLPTGNAPTISSSPGTLGQIALKGSKLHICTGTNAWGTIAIGAFSA